MDRPLQKVYTQGKEYGLYLLIGPLVNANKYPTADATGLIIFVHNSSHEPTSSDGVYVQTGKQTNIVLRKTVTHNYPAPYSKCIRLDTYSSRLYDYMLSLKQTYRQQDCFNLCLQKNIIEQCGCFYTKFPQLVNETQACSNLTHLECIVAQAGTFKGEDTIECEAECPLECETTKFEVQTSSLDFPSEQIYNSFRNDRAGFEFLQRQNNIDLSSFGAFKERFLSVNIFYAYLEYADTRLAPKTSVVDLVSNVGGSLGIFLGFSIFFVVELVEIVAQIVFVLACKTNPQHKTNRVS